MVKKGRRRKAGTPSTSSSGDARAAAAAVGRAARSDKVAMRRRRARGQGLFRMAILSAGFMWFFGKTVLKPLWEDRCQKCADLSDVPKEDADASGACSGERVSMLQIYADTIAVTSSSCDAYSFDDLDPVFGVPKYSNFAGKVKFAEYGALMDADSTLYESVIILNSPAMNWTALHKWTPEYLASKIPEFSKVKRTLDGSSLFVYEDSKRPLSKVYTPRTESVNMTSQEFFQSDRPLYHEEFMNDAWTEALGDDIHPSSFLQMDESAVSDTHVWMSSSKVVAGMHYDFSHNLFAQVRGCKRFVISKTENWGKMRLFSFNDPRDRQSGLEFVDPDAIPPKDRPDVLVADLLPGDLLYLPPMVFHRVLAYPCRGMERVVSVNTWSTKVGGVDFVEDIENQIPAVFRGIKPNGETDEERRDAKKRAKLLGVYLSKLLKNRKANPLDVEEMLLGRIVDQRYLDSEYMQCEADWSVDRCPDFDESSSELDFDEEVDNAAEMFARIQDDGARGLMLASYIERVTSMVVGTRWSCKFLKCVASMNS